MPRFLRATTLWVLMTTAALASTYKGDTVPASDGQGHFAVVRHVDTGKIVWTSKKKQSKQKAEKKADKVAGKMEEEGGIRDECVGPAPGRPEWCL